MYCTVHSGETLVTQNCATRILKCAIKPFFCRCLEEDQQIVTVHVLYVHKINAFKVFCGKRETVTSRCFTNDKLSLMIVEVKH